MVGEARIGFNQIIATVAVDVEQAGRGCAGIRRAHRDAVRRAAGGGDHARTGCGAIAGDAPDRAALLRAGGNGRLRQRAFRPRPYAVARSLRTVMARAVRQRLRPLHVEVGHCRAILHVGCVAPLVEVAEIANVDGQGAAAGDAAADLPGHFGDRRVAPGDEVAGEGVPHVVESMGAIQRRSQVLHLGGATQANDVEIAAGGNAAVVIAQIIGTQSHCTTGADDRIGAYAWPQNILGHRLRGDAVLLVAADVVAAGTARIGQVLVRGIVLVGPQLHAVGGAGAIGR
ncbi:hypothetical protein D3C71_1354310 [compost metagenome]